MSKRSVRMGGLLRCCLVSIQEYKGPEDPGTTVIPCRFHSVDGPTVRLASDGVWEWAGMPNQSER
jgi:hypothetical protein